MHSAIYKEAPYSPAAFLVRLSAQNECGNSEVVGYTDERDSNSQIAYFKNHHISWGGKSERISCPGLSRLQSWFLLMNPVPNQTQTIHLEALQPGTYLIDKYQEKERLSVGLKTTIRLSNSFFRGG